MPSLRQSPRTTAKRNYEEDSVSSDELYNDQLLSQRPHKQLHTIDPGMQKAPTSTIQTSTSVNAPRMRGRLSGIVELPLDVLYEIFSYLFPRDFIQLGRSSKDLRQLLMNTQALTAWKSARRNVAIGEIQVPECPADMNEAQYAYLLFFNNCHHCLSPHALRTILWNSRKRICASCLRSHYETRRIDDTLWPRDERLRLCLPCDLVETRQNHKAVTEIACPRNIADVEEFLESSVSRMQQGPDMLKEWLHSLPEDSQKRAIHAQECSTWMIFWDSSRRIERDRLRQERENAILVKLNDAGWGEELEEQRNFCGLGFLTSGKPFKDPRPMTERVWSNMKESLFAVLDSARTKRLTAQLTMKWTNRHKEFTVLVQKALNQYSRGNTMPPVANFVQFPAFRDVLLKTPIELDITLEMLHDAYSHIGQIAQDWREYADSELLRLANSAGVRVSQQSDLNLAALTFECHVCSDRIRYPRVLVHACTTNCHEFLYYKEHAIGTLQQFYRDTYKQPWSAKHITVSLAEHERRKEIITACGLDPECTKTQTMDHLNPLLRLVTKRGHDSHALVFRWRAAMQCIAHDPHATSLWQLLSDEEARKAAQYEPIIFQPNQIVRSPSSGWIRVNCQHCDEQLAISMLQDHLIDFHGKDHVMRGDWYWGHDTRSDYTVPPSFKVPSSLFATAEIKTQ